MPDEWNVSGEVNLIQKWPYTLHCKVPNYGHFELSQGFGRLISEPGLVKLSRTQI
jgi:hypothetical protein